MACNHESFIKRPFHTSNDSFETSSQNTIVCLVKQADDRVNYVSVSSKETGEAVLSKICNTLGILDEKEYFGLTFQGTKKETLWINLRNKIAKQIPGSSPYQLSLRVKYFIRPSDIIMEQTKHQFFLDIVHHLKEGFWGGSEDIELYSRSIALQTHVQFGPYNPLTTPCKYAIFWPNNSHEMPANFIRLTATQHQSLEHVSPEHARYELMNLAYEKLLFYGCHVFEVKDIFTKQMKILVGPEFIFICDESTKLISRHPYSSVNSITLATRVININFLDDSGTVKARLFELSSQKLAHSLYRCITEVNAFFLTDTISEELISQRATNFKDTLGFFFDHQKEFIFDVSYTAREVLDKTRRHIHQGIMATQMIGLVPASTSENRSLEMTENTTKCQPHIHLPHSRQHHRHHHREVTSLGDSQETRSLSGKHRTHNSSTSNSDSIDSIDVHRIRSDSEKSESVTLGEDELNEIVQTRLKQAHLCQICCDNAICRIFLPCGHALCCEKCSNCVEQCPMCRCSIDIRHPVFFPTIPAEYIPESSTHAQEESTKQDDSKSSHQVDSEPASQKASESLPVKEEPSGCSNSPPKVASANILRDT